MAPKAFPPRHVDPIAAANAANEVEDDEEEEVELTDIMNDMTTAERRKVYALKGLLDDFKSARLELRKEIVAAQLEHAAAAQRLYDIRRAIVTGARDISAEEIAKLPQQAAFAAAPSTADEPKKKKATVVAPNDEKQQSALASAAAQSAGGIPNFWLTALSNTEVFDGLITERDRPSLSHLLDIRCSYIDGNPQNGVVITFAFAPNEFFTNTTLTKTYHMEYNEDDGDAEIGQVEGCAIDWKSPRTNLTVVVKQKKQRNKNSKDIRVVEREEKCESFYHFFSPPQEADGDDDDEADDYDEQEMEMDIEAGQALLEDVIPKAAYYYSGKSVEDVAKELSERFGFGGENDDDDDDDDEEEEDDEEDEGVAAVDFRGMVQSRGRGGAAGDRGGASRGRGGAGAPPQQQECKQQ